MVDFSGSFAWNTLNEEQRYEVWSRHVEARDDEPYYDYVAFCNAMDNISTTA